MLLVADVEARKVSLTTVRVQGDDDLILFYSLSLFSFMPSQQDWFIMFNLMQLSHRFGQMKTTVVIGYVFKHEMTLSSTIR